MTLFDPPASTPRWHCQRHYRLGETRGMSYLERRALPLDPRIIHADGPGWAGAVWGRGEGTPADPREVLDTDYSVHLDDDRNVSVRRL